MTSLSGEAGTMVRAASALLICCDPLAHPGRHGRRHEAFVSSENCTYVELIKICFFMGGGADGAQHCVDPD